MDLRICMLPDATHIVGVNNASQTATGVYRCTELLYTEYTCILKLSYSIGHCSQTDVYIDTGTVHPDLITGHLWGNYFCSRDSTLQLNRS